MTGNYSYRREYATVIYGQNATAHCIENKSGHLGNGIFQH